MIPSGDLVQECARTYPYTHTHIFIHLSIHYVPSLIFTCWILVKYNMEEQLYWLFDTEESNMEE